LGHTAATQLRAQAHDQKAATASVENSRGEHGRSGEWSEIGKKMRIDSLNLEHVATEILAKELS
jgi:hypothetical protein